MSTALLVSCSNTECERTIRAACAAFATLVESAPGSGSWIFVADTAQWRSATFCHPPAYTLILGDITEAPEAETLECLPLPLRLRTLVSRIQACIASLSHRRKPLLPRHALTLDSDRFALIDAAQNTYPLTEKEARLLEALIQAEGAPVSKEQLLSQVWSYQPGIPTRTLETHLSRLRTKLQETGAAPLGIQLQADGYVIVAL